MSHRVRRALLATAVVAVLGFTALSPTSVVSPAQAAVDQSLPTWDDVQKAKNDQAATASKITEIEGLLAQLATEVEATRQQLATAVAAYEQAENELLQAQQRFEALDARLKESTAQAETAADEAGTLVGLMYRSGGVDRNAELLLESDASTSDALLERLAWMSKATERNSKIAEEATRAANDAQSLSDQADAVAQERERLALEAQQRKEEAAAAAAAAQERQRVQQEQKATLDAQLAALKDTTAKTVEGYEERVRQEAEEQRRIDEERRKAEEEARKKNNGGGSAPPSGGSGWSRPIYSYWVSDEFGGARSHGGIDLAASMWTPIYAASAGRVTACYEFSNYGNTVDITHPDGSMTRYAHQPYGGIAVSCGQWVERGQLIGHVGSTGWSSGPHLHFETWPSSSYRVNPRGFMAARGVYF